MASAGIRNVKKAFGTTQLVDISHCRRRIRRVGRSVRLPHIHVSARASMRRTASGEI
jgi:hypothetical protein